MAAFEVDDFVLFFGSWVRDWRWVGLGEEVRRRRCEGRRGGGLTWHMIDGFSVFQFFLFF